jgi:hypothetical protein
LLLIATREQDQGPRQSRGLHQMPEDACRWELAPAWTHRGRVVPGHDVGSSHEWGRIEALREPGSRPVGAAQTGRCRLPASTQLKDTIPERWIQAESRQRKAGVTPASSCQAGRPRAGLLHPAPATEQDQTKLYGFVVNSWSDKVLSVQRIWTRTRTR